MSTSDWWPPWWPPSAGLDAWGRSRSSTRKALLRGGVGTGMEAQEFYRMLSLKHPCHLEEETYPQWSAPAAPHTLRERWDSETHSPTPLAWRCDSACWCDGGGCQRLTRPRRGAAGDEAEPPTNIGHSAERL